MSLSSRRLIAIDGNEAAASARFQVVERSDPARFHRLAELAEEDARRRRALYSHLAGMAMPVAEPGRVS